MMRQSIVKDQEFEEMTIVKADSKNRIPLGPRAKGAMNVKMYKVYRNACGQIILDPQVTIPAYEAWLFKSKKAAGMVQKGLEEAKKKRLVEPKEDYSKYVDDDA